MTIMASVNCSHRITHGLLVPLSSSSLGPCSTSRRAASSSPSPDAAWVPRAFRTSSTSEVCQTPTSPSLRLSIRRFHSLVSSPAGLARTPSTKRFLEGGLPERGFPLSACRLLRHLPISRRWIDEDRSWPRPDYPGGDAPQPQSAHRPQAPATHRQEGRSLTFPRCL